jgi:hypothetical protein
LFYGGEYQEQQKAFRELAFIPTLYTLVEEWMSRGVSEADEPAGAAAPRLASGPTG